MPPVGFEPTISADERPKTYALDCAATGTDINKFLFSLNGTFWIQLGNSYFGDCVSYCRSSGEQALNVKAFVTSSLI